MTRVSEGKLLTESLKLKVEANLLAGVSQTTHLLKVSLYSLSYFFYNFLLIFGSDLDVAVG